MAAARVMKSLSLTLCCLAVASAFSTPVLVCDIFPACLPCAALRSPARMLCTLEQTRLGNCGYKQIEFVHECGAC